MEVRGLLAWAVLACLALHCRADVVVLGGLTSLDPADGAISPQHADQQDKMQKDADKQIPALAADAAAEATSEAAEPAAAAVGVAAAAAVALDKEQEQAAVAASAQQEPEAEPAEGGQEQPTNQQERAQGAARQSDTTEEQLAAQAKVKKKLSIERAKQQAVDEEIPTEPAAEKKHVTVQDAEKKHVTVEDAEKKQAPSANLKNEGFYKMPGLTVDAPAITRIEGATLKDCLKSCKQVHHCHGVQYSDDKKIQGGNCLLMSRGMQFSNTFDYYERPGMNTLDKVEQMDQLMVHKWKTQDDSQEDLGGLSADDVPGATKVNTKKAAEEVAKFKALHEIKNAVAQIDDGIVQRQKARLDELRQELGESQKQILSTRSRAKKLRSRAHKAGQKYIALAKESAAAHVKSAKLTVQLAEYAKRSSKAQHQVKLAGSKVKEYMQAYRAYKAAGNPLAAKMSVKFKKWQDAVSAARVNLLRVRQHRLDLKAKAMEAKSQAKKLEQDAHWADLDHKALVEKRTAEDKLVKLAQHHEQNARKELDEHVRVHGQSS